MIELTRLNGSKFVINAELIETLEEQPNSTVVSLASNNRYVVLEKRDAIIERVVEYRRKVNAGRAAVNPIQGFERT